MPDYDVRYSTPLEVVVRVTADDEDQAADGSWQLAQDYLQTLVGDHRAVTATADLDGQGADEVKEGVDVTGGPRVVVGDAASG